jgi:hypothetical protein
MTNFVAKPYFNGCFLSQSLRMTGLYNSTTMPSLAAV